MATTGYTASNYYSIPDAAGMTLPNENWTWLYVLKTDAITSVQDITGNGVYEAANTLNLYVDNQGNIRLDLGGLQDPDDPVAVSADTWYVVTVTRDSGQLDLRLVPFGSTSVSTGTGVAISAAYDSPTGYVFGILNDLALPFDGGMADAIFIPGVALSDADMGDIATGTAMDSTGWWSSREFHLIMSNGTDHTGNHTVTVHGSPSTLADPAQLVRFAAGDTVDGNIGTIVVGGVSGNVVFQQLTIDGTIGGLSAQGIGGNVIHSIAAETSTATTGFSATNFHNVADDADLTAPDGDWARIVVCRPDSDVTGSEFILSDEGWGLPNSFNLISNSGFFGVKVNETTDRYAGFTAGAWHVVCVQRSGTSLTIRSIQMDTTSVSTSATTTLNEAVDSVNPLAIGLNGFTGAISDVLFINGDTVSNSDLQDIATGTAIDSFSWYSNRVFWGILKAETGLDQTGNHTVTENGTLSTTAGSATLLRFGAERIYGNVAPLAIVGVQGDVEIERIISGSVAQLSVAGSTSEIVFSSTINGALGAIQIGGSTGGVDFTLFVNGVAGAINASGLAGFVIDPDSAINAPAATMLVQGVQGNPLINVTIDLNVATVALGGLVGAAPLAFEIGGIPTTIQAQGETGETLYPVAMDGAPGVGTIQGLTGWRLYTLLVNGAIGVMAAQAAAGSITYSLDLASTAAEINLLGIQGLRFQTFPPPIPETLAGANTYFIGKNLIDTSSVWASTVASGYPYANLQLDKRSKTYRSTGTSVIVTGGWATAQTLSAAGLAFTNLTTGSTVAVHLYTNAGDPSPVYLSGTKVVDFTYDSAGGTYFSLLFDDEYTVEKIEIIIDSTGNPDGYIEIGRVITGFAFTPEFGADFGLSVGRVDSSRTFMADSGDILADSGNSRKTISLTLGMLRPVDRQSWVNIIRNCGAIAPVWASTYENSPNSEERQSCIIYGRFNPLPDTNAFQLDFHSSNVDLKEI